MKQIFVFLIIVVTLSSCDTSTPTESSLIQYIPRKASVVIKTNDLLNLQSELINNDFIQAFEKTEVSKFISSQSTILSYLKPKGETLICFTKLGNIDYEVSIITKVPLVLSKKDSLQPSQGIQALKDNPSYTYLIKDDILIASTSTLLLENIERNTKQEVTTDSLFKNAYQSASTNASATALIKGKEGATLFKDLFPSAVINSLENSFSWSAIDINLDTNDIRTSGVILSEKEEDLRFNLLRNTAPKANRIVSIAPTSLKTLTAITYKDWEIFKNNKADYLKVDPSLFKIPQEALLSTFDEIGNILIGEQEVIIAVSKDINATQDEMTSDIKSNFRGLDIYDFKDKDAFAKAYNPLLQLPPVTMYTIIEDFYIFADNQNALESIIANYQNKAVLIESVIFQNTFNQLSDASSYLYIENLDSGYFKSRVSSSSEKILENIQLDNYHYVANQLVQEGDYMLLNGLILKNENIVEAGGIAQIANVKLNADLIMSPQLVRNHRTNGMDIVTQDINNVLYLISNAGKVLWQKELDGPVLGKMQQVDLYRNGRLQLAFTTPKSFYILDRNGKEVAPFSLGFTDAITQPLSIFDYENNRKYRFVIVQNDKVMMYDKDGKSVKGFTFNTAAAPIIFPPAHIRIGSKDYITVVENTGKLHILNRTGQSRIDVTKQINFGDTPVFKKGNTFQTYSINGDKISIDTNGKLTESISDYSSDSKIATSSKTSVGQRENELIINGNKEEIVYGLYSKPTISVVNNKTYISITNTESSEVFIYNDKGQLLPNFPVYGISPVDVNFLERKKNLGFVTLGSATSILIYSMN